MRNILFDGYEGPRLPRSVQLRRIKRVMECELTPIQRETVISYYFLGQNICQIARDREVNKSTVSRTLKRAEDRIRRCLRY